jgi:hypothetical protein
MLLVIFFLANLLYAFRSAPKICSGNLVNAIKMGGAGYTLKSQQRCIIYYMQRESLD